jgi:hypothetical protein
MAICPNCKGLMSSLAIVCPHCGYDFPSDKPEKHDRRGIAYTAFADLVLVVGMICAVIGAIAMLAVILFGIISKNFIVGASGVLGFILQSALYVVYQRVADMN